MILNCLSWAKRYKDLISFSVIILFIFVIRVFQEKRSKWHRYYQNKLRESVRPLLQKVLTYYIQTGKKPGQSVDLGAGVGNETVDLLKKDWRVTSVDAESKAVDIIKQRADAQNCSGRLKVICSKFENLNWANIETSDLVFASYSLPFCHRKKFQGVWKDLISKLRPGGYFAGHFFGNQHLGFSKNDMENMVFFSKHEMLTLFKQFKVESILENIQDTVSGTGARIHEHVFEVIAQKL